MEIKIKNKRSLLIIIACGILFYWGLNHLSVFLSILKQFLGVVSPFLMGGAIAFVLNVPMKNIEKRLLSVFKEKRMLLRAVSILTSFLLALGLQYLFLPLEIAVPEAQGAQLQLFFC